MVVLEDLDWVTVSGPRRYQVRYADATFEIGARGRHGALTIPLEKIESIRFVAADTDGARFFRLQIEMSGASMRTSGTNLLVPETHRVAVTDLWQAVAHDLDRVGRLDRLKQGASVAQMKIAAGFLALLALGAAVVGVAMAVSGRVGVGIGACALAVGLAVAARYFWLRDEPGFASLDAALSHRIF
ncbi:MAG: hypothetical protein AAF914_02320 [Pseudomonadota bacterium]